MDNARPDPEQLLARLKTEAAEPSRRGRMRVFFGFAAGVGKTYAMLEAARAAAAEGTDVVLGYIEPHARPETAALTLGLDMLPAKKVEYRGVFLREFDLEAALARKPRLLLVDELAHSNADGLRHAKRWQDVDELLEAGIDVWTTLNVQHVESLNDIVAQITGVVVRETIPDAVFDRADEIELIDLPPDDLLERLREGKIYVSAQAEKAMERFFKKSNLIALREIAMRRTADRINVQVQTARLGETRAHTWPTNERLLVCVGPSPTSAKVIRTARRMASALRAPWIALTTESTARTLSDRERAQVAQHLNLAEQLGAETATVTGSDVVAEILSYALARNVTKIVIGKTAGHPWWKFWKRPIVDRLLAASGEIDVYVIHGSMEGAVLPEKPTRELPVDYSGFRFATMALLAASLVAWLFQAAGASEANVLMVFMLAVVVVAVFQGRGPSIFSAIAAALVFDFFFIPPYFSFVVEDTQYVFAMGVKLVVALVISTLMGRVRDQAVFARERERRTVALLRLSRVLSGMAGRLQLVASAEQQLHEILDADVAVLLPDEERQVSAASPRGTQFETPAERAVAQWVFEHGRAAGIGTDTLPAAAALYLPLPSPEGTMGVLAVRDTQAPTAGNPDQRRFLEAFASQIGLAVARDWLAEQSQRVLAQAEAERLRNSLLSSVSHDLRTPLSAIAGASSTLLSSHAALDDPTRRELLESIYIEAHRLSRLVENLLHMTRMEAGAVEVAKTWQSLEEIVGTALGRLTSALGKRPIETDLPADLSLVPLDGQLIEQVLVNLMENAVQYSPDGTPIAVQVREQEQQAIVTVADRGPGLASGEAERIFDKFFRGAHSGTRRGAGLGLAICRAIVTAHGGKIWAENRPGGGASFTFTLPIEGAPPAAPAAPSELAIQTTSDA